MGKKIIIENLPQEKKIRDLLEILDPVGTVQWAFIASDPNTNRSAGYAYAEMWSDTEAELIIGHWNNKEWANKVLSVRRADSKSTPDALDDKSIILKSPPDFIYSVIRFQLSAPAGSLIFVNEIAKGIADEV